MANLLTVSESVYLRLAFEVSREHDLNEVSKKIETVCDLFPDYIFLMNFESIGCEDIGAWGIIIHLAVNDKHKHHLVLRNALIKEVNKLMEEIDT